MDSTYFSYSYRCIHELCTSTCSPTCHYSTTCSVFSSHGCIGKSPEREIELDETASRTIFQLTSGVFHPEPPGGWSVQDVRPKMNGNPNLYISRWPFTPAIFAWIAFIYARTFVHFAQLAQRGKECWSGRVVAGDLCVPWFWPFLSVFHQT